MDEKMEKAMKGIYENLTDEQKEKANACKTSDELMKLAGEWGIELPDDALEAVAGGGCGGGQKYPRHHYDWSCEHQQDYGWDSMSQGECTMCIYGEDLGEMVNCHYPDRVH